MKKILLFATGGTISSVQSTEGLTPGMSSDELLRYLPAANTDYIVESRMLMSIDSTNMQPEFWATMAESVYKNYKDYDGFVITHGTDTMAYTAAALAYMLQNLNKPVVITGAQVPISFDKTDAIKNLADAVRFANEDIGGVFLVFDGKVITGTRAVKLRTKSYTAFESVNHPYVAYIEGSEVRYKWKSFPKVEKELQLYTNLCPDVLLLKLYPGMRPEMFDALKDKRLFNGVIIESFGSGGVPFQGRNLLPKIKELVDAGVAVVITTQCLEEGEDLYKYEVGRKVATQSLIVLSGDMNTEAIVPKLMWVLGQTSDMKQIKKLMETPIAYDLTPKTVIDNNI